MVSIINFGASPFRVLFLIVFAIFIAVLAANLIALVLRIVIDYRAKKLIERPSRW